MVNMHRSTFAMLFGDHGWYVRTLPRLDYNASTLRLSDLEHSDCHGLVLQVLLRFNDHTMYWLKHRRGSQDTHTNR